MAKVKTIIHVDMDAFFAAVESRDNPDLKGKPLIVGAMPTDKRGVVSTCSYEARVFGVRSAMPISEAYRRCPHAVFLSPDIRKYERVSRVFREIWCSYSDKVEYVSLDEGYIDVTASLSLFKDALSIANEIKRRTLDVTGLTCSIGIGYSMATAKLASEEKKPDGLFVIPDEEFFRRLVKDRSIKVVFGIGTKSQETLNKAGIFTVKDIWVKKDKVIKLLGNRGRQIIELAEGVDRREVVPHDDADAKSIGKEVTFQYDTTDIDYLKSYAVVFARKISHKARCLGLFAQTVTVKITYSDMVVITRSKTQRATNCFEDIYKLAWELIDSIDLRPVRLVGVSLSNFEKYHQYTLDEIGDKPAGRMDETIAAIGGKYGIIKTGIEVEAEHKINQVLDSL